MSAVDPVKGSRDQRQGLSVLPVEGKRARREFIRLPWSIYAGDPQWIPPLMWERRQHLSSGNPYFAHADWRAWLACRDSKSVGRISAQVDRLHLDHHRDATGFFGMLEAEDDPEIFRLLLATAEIWLRGQGMRRILGPFSLSINDECGLLVEGFETPPMIMMGHAPRYYSLHLEAQGYAKAKDLLAYLVDIDFTLPAAAQNLTAREGVQVRPLRRSELTEDLNILRDIFNDAWSRNWGFVPFTEAEFESLGRHLAFLVDDDFVQIAEVAGEPAAMIVALPNLNEAVRDLNGRLLPFGWLKLLWRLKVTHPKTARVALMGVRQCYQQTLLGPALALRMIEALRGPGRRRGLRQVELSWILEDNRRMRGIIEAIGGRCYKRYRLYGKELAPA